MDDISETKEIFCSVSKNLFNVRELRIILPELILSSKIVQSISRQLGLPTEELEHLTTKIKQIEAGSLTGNQHLLEKVLRLKLRLIVEDCELVNDEPP